MVLLSNISEKHALPPDYDIALSGHWKIEYMCKLHPNNMVLRTVAGFKWQIMTLFWPHHSESLVACFKDSQNPLNIYKPCNINIKIKYCDICSKQSISPAHFHIIFFFLNHTIVIAKLKLLLITVMLEKKLNFYFCCN